MVRTFAQVVQALGPLLGRVLAPAFMTTISQKECSRKSENVVRPILGGFQQFEKHGLEKSPVW